VIVVLANEPLTPVRNGGRARVAGIVGALAAGHEVRVVVAQGRRGLDGEGEALPRVHRSRLAALAGSGPRLGRGLLDDRAVDHLASLTRGADAVLVSHSYLAPGLDRLGLPLVVDLPNLEVERQASIGGALGRWEAAKARRWEPAACRAASACLVVDERDAAVVREWGAREVLVVPNAADAPVSPPSPADGCVLAVADWRYGPNAEALRELVDRVWPTVVGRLPQARLVLAGRGSEAAGGLGFVEDLGPLHDAAAVVVAPARRGAGTQLKVVEALARARVVVTTSYGARSVPPGAGSAAVVDDDLAAGLSRVLADVAWRHARERGLAATAELRSWARAAAPLTARLEAARA
jgi:polysaccharide biosynthesis protein PslH